MSTYHTPVLLQEVCTALEIKPGLRYIDATLGGGGHTRAIIQLGGQVLGIDQDPQALSACPDLPKLTKHLGNFIHLQEIAAAHTWSSVSGILLDLGVSMHQLVSPERGFSFQKSGPLDMRMDPGLPHTAATLVNILSAAQLAEIFTRYSQEPTSKSLAKKIVAARPISTTMQLAEIIGQPDKSRRIFQALRIAVNDELTALKTVLPQAISLLAPSGRLAVISFHSLEDRIVKQQFAAWQKSGIGQIVSPEIIQPSAAEIAANPASHSAKLRVFSKL